MLIQGVILIRDRSIHPAQTKKQTNKDHYDNANNNSLIRVFIHSMILSLKDSVEACECVCVCVEDTVSVKCCASDWKTMKT